MFHPIIKRFLPCVFALLFVLSSSARTCFWHAFSEGYGSHRGESVYLDSHFSGQESASGQTERGGAQAGDINVMMNEVSLRALFEVEVETQTLGVYSYAEICTNAIPAEAFSELFHRDYFQASGDESLTIRIQYEFSEFYSVDDAGEASLMVYSQVHNTDGKIYPFSGDKRSMHNMLESPWFSAPDNTPLGSISCLGYQSSYGCRSDYENLNLDNFCHEFVIEPGDVIALDTLISAKAVAGDNFGHVTGCAYAALQNGPYPVGSGFGTPGNPVPDWHARYSIEIISGTGSFEPYSAPAPKPVIELKPASLAEGGLSLVINSEVGTSYVIESSTNLVDWSPWITTNGTGAAIPVSIDTTKQEGCFYRIP